MRTIAASTLTALAALLLTLAPGAAAPATSRSATPHIAAVAHALHVRNPGTEGKVWWLSRDNTLPKGWLLQGPDCWNAPTCGPGPLPPGAGPYLTRMAQLIGGARETVDFAGPWPPPDGRFRQAIVDGLRETAAAGHHPTVRFLFGTPPAQFGGRHFETWFRALVRDVGHDLPMEAASM